MLTYNKNSDKRAQQEFVGGRSMVPACRIYRYQKIQIVVKHFILHYFVDSLKFLSHYFQRPYVNVRDDGVFVDAEGIV